MIFCGLGCYSVVNERKISSSEVAGVRFLVSSVFSSAVSEENIEVLS